MSGGSAAPNDSAATGRGCRARGRDSSRSIGPQLIRRTDPLRHHRLKLVVVSIRVDLPEKGVGSPSGDHAGVLEAQLLKDPDLLEQKGSRAAEELPCPCGQPWRGWVHRCALTST